MAVDTAKQITLSGPQRQLWAAHLLDPTGRAYTVPVILDITGPVDAGALARSYANLIQRHDALRLIIDIEHGRSQPRLAPRLPALRHVDISTMTYREGMARCVEVTDNELRPGFSAGAPLVRACLITLRGARHRLILLFQHTVIDGTSLRIALSELIEDYEALQSGRPLPERSPAGSYLDYARQERASASGGESLASIEFWRTHLKGAPRGLALGAPRTPVPRYEGSHCLLQLNQATTARIGAFAEAAGASASAVLYSAFTILLHRATFTDDLVIGVPVTTRRAPWEATVGPMLITLPLRSRLRADVSLRAVVAESARLTMQALDHRIIPPANLAAQAGNGGIPLFGALFSYFDEDRATTVPRLGEATVTPVLAETHSSKADLSLSACRMGGVVQLLLEYDASILSSATAQSLLKSFIGLLEAGLMQPHRPVLSLPMAADQGEARTSTANVITDPYYSHGLLPSADRVSAARSRPDSAVPGVGLVFSPAVSGLQRRRSHGD